METNLIVSCPTQQIYQSKPIVEQGLMVQVLHPPQKFEHQLF
jgi:hypothetical protein